MYSAYLALRYFVYIIFLSPVVKGSGPSRIRLVMPTAH